MTPRWSTPGPTVVASTPRGAAAAASTQIDTWSTATGTTTAGRLGCLHAAHHQLDCQIACVTVSDARQPCASPRCCGLIGTGARRPVSGPRYFGAVCIHQKIASVPSPEGGIKCKLQFVATNRFHIFMLKCIYRDIVLRQRRGRDREIGDTSFLHRGLRLS